MIIHVARHTVRVCMTVVGIVLILLALFTLSAHVWGCHCLSDYKSSDRSAGQRLPEEPGGNR